jgi:hypothetical protein
MSRRRLVLMIAAVILLAALWPVSTLSAPKWSVYVLDDWNRPVAGVLVRESYQNHSAELVGHEEDLYTDADGSASFAPKSVKSSPLKRLSVILLSRSRGVHASFGPHSSVAAFRAGQVGDDIRGGLLFSWEGSPAQMKSVLRLHNE